MRMEFRKAALPVDQLLSNYVDAPKFLAACEHCPNYGRIGSCPPYDFSVTDYWRDYDSLEALCVQAFVPDELRARVYSQEELNAAVESVIAEARGALDSRLAGEEAAQPGSRMLSAGKCVRCADCACAHGQPCRFPEEVRYSIESLGGDVVALARDLFDLPLLWAEGGQLPEYFVLVGGLLKKREA